MTHTTPLLAAGALILAALSASPVAPAHIGSSTGTSPGPSDETRDISIDVAAERFSFTPSELRATVGQPLVIHLTSDDTDHGFRILDTDIDVAIPKRGRGTATVTFVPAKAGRYVFECSKLCGAGHSFMRGVIIVEDAGVAR